MASRGYSSLRRVGFSLQWLLLLRSVDSRHAGFSSCGTRALERRLSSCDARGLVAPRHVGSSQTRARTRVPCIGRRILNHCTTREVQVAHCFNLHFPDDICQTSLHLHICHLCIFFGGLSVQGLCPFKKKSGCFFIIEFKNSLYILDNSPLSHVSFANIFCQSVACLVAHSLDSVFLRAEIFNFNKVQLINHF